MQEVCDRTLEGLHAQARLVEQTNSAFIPQSECPWTVSCWVALPFSTNLRSQERRGRSQNEQAIRLSAALWWCRSGRPHVAARVMSHAYRCVQGDISDAISALEVVATAVGKDSELGRVLRLVEEGQMSKVRIQRLAGS